MYVALLVLVALTLAVLKGLFVVIEEREEGILERLGKFQRVLHSGFRLKWPIIERVAYRHDTRELVLDIPAQECITKNNVQVMVDGLLYLKVMDVQKASYNVDDYRRSAVAMAQATMRSEIGKLDLDDTFSERARMNDNIVQEIDEASEPWGVKVMRYEVKNITPSEETIKNMEQKMESERERREYNIEAEGSRDARKLESEGQQEYEINVSEGEKQRTINESEGQAREIELLAEANSYAVDRLAKAASQPGGQLAIRTRLAQQYVEDLERVIDEADVSVLPTELASVRSVVEAAARGAGGHDGDRRAAAGGAQAPTGAGDR